MKTIFYFTGILTFFFLFSCSDKTNENALNKEASLPDAMLDKVSGLQVINSSINNKKHTTSLLYGNQKTVERLKSNELKLQKGEKLVSIENLESNAEKEGFNYQKFEGNKMELQKDTLGNAHRIKELLNQKKANVPQL